MGQQCMTRHYYKYNAAFRMGSYAAPPDSWTGLLPREACKTIGMPPVVHNMPYAFSELKTLQDTKMLAVKINKSARHNNNNMMLQQRASCCATQMVNLQCAPLKQHTLIINHTPWQPPCNSNCGLSAPHGHQTSTEYSSRLSCTSAVLNDLLHQHPALNIDLELCSAQFSMLQLTTFNLCKLSMFNGKANVHGPQEGLCLSDQQAPQHDTVRCNVTYGACLGPMTPAGAHQPALTQRIQTNAKQRQQAAARLHLLRLHSHLIC